MQKNKKSCLDSGPHSNFSCKDQILLSWPIRWSGSFMMWVLSPFTWASFIPPRFKTVDPTSTGVALLVGPKGHRSLSSEKGPELHTSPHLLAYFSCIAILVTLKKKDRNNPSRKKKHARQYSFVNVPNTPRNSSESWENIVHSLEHVKNQSQRKKTNKMGMVNRIISPVIWKKNSIFESQIIKMGKIRDKYTTPLP